MNTDGRSSRSPLLIGGAILALAAVLFVVVVAVHSTPPAPAPPVPKAPAVTATPGAPLAPAEPKEAPPAPSPAPISPEAEADVRKVADASLGEEDRLYAASRLRARGELPPAALQALSLLTASAADADIRRELIRLLRGIRNDELTQAWISRLQTDAVLEVRKAAAEALGDLKADTAVRQVLEQAQRSDPAPGVRNSIRNVLRTSRSSP